MKKMIAVFIAGVLLTTAGFVGAAKVRTITRSHIVGMRIDVQWDGTLTNIVDVIVTAQSVEIDDAGARAGDTTERIAFNDLPNPVQSGISNIIKHMGRALSNKGAAEDVEPTVPATMPGRSRPNRP